MSEEFFTEISNTKPFLKMAAEGFAGTGKTYTLALVAIGLHKRIKSTKPVVIFDTERAAKFLKKPFRDAGIQVLVKESRSLADLKTTMEKMREGLADILIIDSITHIWVNVLESYKKKKNRTALQFQDWGIIKPTWQVEFSDPFVNDPYHVLMAGRAGFEYESEINPETNKREIYKSGVKMKVEGETAYEPDLLVMMERFEDILGEKKSVYRQATVLKDRSTVIDGGVFKNPTYDDFAPAIEEMLSDPNYSVGKEADSAGLFHDEEDKVKYTKERDALLEEIEGELVRAYPSTAQQAKAAKQDLIEGAFGTRSWKRVQQKTVSELEDGLSSIKIAVREIVDLRNAESEVA